MFSEVGPLAIPSFSLDGTRWCASTGREPPTGFVETEAGLKEIRRFQIPVHNISNSQCVQPVYDLPE